MISNRNPNRHSKSDNKNQMSFDFYFKSFLSDDLDLDLKSYLKDFSQHCSVQEHDINQLPI